MEPRVLSLTSRLLVLVSCFAYSTTMMIEATLLRNAGISLKSHDALTYVNLKSNIRHYLMETPPQNCFRHNSVAKFWEHVTPTLK
jgi:hypothetical protein